ncbi:MAG: hypothetical protein WA383_07850 [Terriglobales bacterium]
MDKEESVCNSTCEDQINMAERELSAFIRAVTELFGPEQARLSTEDWLDESEPMDSPHRATSKEWRAVTVAASARLANRERKAASLATRRLTGATLSLLVMHPDVEN